MPVFLIGAVYVVAYGIFYGGMVLPLLPLISVACIGYIGWKIVVSGSVPIVKLVILVVYLGALALFYAAEEQIGSTLMLLGERHASKGIFGFEAPSSLLLGVNPATIILLGPFVNRICRGFSSGNSQFPWRLVIAFGLASVAFAAIALACAFPDAVGQVSLLSLFCGIIVVSAAELLIGPTVYSYCSEIAPEDQQGTMMGLVPMGFAMASFCGGCLSGLMAAPEEATLTSLPLYTAGYSVIAMMLGGAAVAIAIGIPMIYRKFMREVPLS